MRWFTPPPICTAHFSAILKFGVVLRVSNTLQFVCEIDSWIPWVTVAIPLIRCSELSKIRSSKSMSRVSPFKDKRISPSENKLPSGTKGLSVTFGACCSSANLQKSTPAKTPIPLAISRFLQVDA